jgi:hypothetical protein
VVKRQSQSSAVRSNFDPQSSNAVGGLAGSAAADPQQDANLSAFLLSSTLSAAALAVLTDIYGMSGTSEAAAASPLPAAFADANSGEHSFQAAAITDTSQAAANADTSNVATGDVSTDAPVVLRQHASDESGPSVTDSGINVAVLPDSTSSLDGAAQAVADGALPPSSDIQTLNELSSDSSDVQIVHDDVAHGGSMVFNPADNSGQNFAAGIVVANAANAQDAASNALGTSQVSITGFFSVSTGPTITAAGTTAGMASADAPGNQAPGTAITVPPSYDWQGFAVQGSQTGGTQSGTGSNVVVVTSGGITIDLIYDTAAMGAPASFRTGIEQAASLIAAAVSDKIKIGRASCRERV